MRKRCSRISKRSSRMNYEEQKDEEKQQNELQGAER
jgi:hypothetical protein